MKYQETRTKLLEKRREDNARDLTVKFDRPYIIHDPIYEEHEEYRNSPPYQTIHEKKADEKRAARESIGLTRDPLECFPNPHYRPQTTRYSHLKLERTQRAVELLEAEPKKPMETWAGLHGDSLDHMKITPLQQTQEMNAITRTKLLETRRDERKNCNLKYEPVDNGIHAVKPSNYDNNNNNINEEKPWYEQRLPPPDYKQYYDPNHGDFVLKTRKRPITNILDDPFKTYCLTEEEKKQREKKHGVEMKITQIPQEYHPVYIIIILLLLISSLLLFSLFPLIYSLFSIYYILYRDLINMVRKDTQQR